MIAGMFIALGAYTRFIATALLSPEFSRLVHLAGWILRMLAVWLVALSVNAWPPFLLVPALALIGTAISLKFKLYWFHRVALDAAAFIPVGLLSVPPMTAESLITGALVVLLISTAAEIVFNRSQVWLRVMASSLSAVASVLLIVVQPSAAAIAGNLVLDRFFLYPQAPAAIISRAVTIDTENMDREGTLWAPYLEWSLQNTDYAGNPFDVIAQATFTHIVSGETRTTGMFYVGDDVWQFRFSGTQTGEWTFTTTSDARALNGHSGRVIITENPDPDILGFVTSQGNKWGRMGSKYAFVPQYIMVGGPQYYYEDLSRLDEDIRVFMEGHGFNGVHVLVFCRWFDINQERCGNINTNAPNPDLRTFEALDEIITRVHAADGVVHIWVWGDQQRTQTPIRWGLNGDVDRRLQRYIAARLGPLPGWTMGYGFDLGEWVDEEPLDTWHANMHEYLGWHHYLGARASKNELDQISEEMDYSGYEQHRPDYEMYVTTIETRPDKPSFSEDRFRVRQGGYDYKDYDEEMTRRGLWHATMAGGVAGIWGHMDGRPEANNGLESSAPYPNADEILTYFTFFEDRFLYDLERCNDLTSAVCLRTPDNLNFIFYAEDVAEIQLDLTGMPNGLPMFAVDTRQPYAEIPVDLTAGDQTWSAPHSSDWAIAIGEFQPAASRGGRSR